MNFLKRLKFYLIGVGLGILMVMAIFKDRKLTSWTPANQVIKEINEKNLILGSRAECMLNCAGYSNPDSIKLLLTNADIDFGASEVKDHDKRTYIIKIDENSIVEAHLIVYKDSIKLSEVKLSDLACQCP